MGKKIAQLIAGCKKPVDELTPREVWTSESFARYCKSGVDFLTKDFTVPPTVEVLKDKSDFVAYTTGDKIVLNPYNSIAGWYVSTSAQIMANLGILYHEIGHVLFLDFEAEEKAKECIQTGTFYGNPPVLPLQSRDEEEKLKEFMGEYKAVKYAAIFEKIIHELVNIIADPHDEEKMAMTFGGVVEEAISFSTDAFWNNQKFLEDYTKEDEENNKIGIMFSLILQYARFGEIPVQSERTLVKSSFYRTLSLAMPYIDNARYTDDSLEKYSNINQVLYFLWDYIKDILKEDNPDNSSNGNSSSDTNNGGGGSSGNSGGLTQEQQEKIQKQLQNAASNVSSATAPTNRKSAKKQPSAPTPAKSSGNAAHRHDQNSTGDPTVTGSILNACSNELAENQADKEAQGMDLAQVYGTDQNSTHRGIPVHPKRCTTSANDADTILQEIRPCSKRMQKKVMEILRDQQMGTTAYHKLYGDRFCAGDAYRPDGACFSNKKQPMNVPNMAIAVLVDQSGSMRGTRSDYAMRAAAMLFDFCDGLDIPCHVAGHNTSGSGVNYMIYSGYDGVASRDIRRICSIPSNVGGCNRDGCAITISADSLDKRAEENRILFIICDGQPNHNNYGGAGARDDIKSIVSKYHKKGIEIIACAIGDDKNHIQEIYGNDFLNIDHVERMPMQLVKILKKKLINA